MKAFFSSPVLAWIASLTLAQWSDVAGIASFVAATSYTLWRWRRDARKDAHQRAADKLPDSVSNN
jgi:hypothetical protein